MAAPPFRLASVKKYRGYQRDLCRQYLAEALAQLENCEQQLQETEQLRLDQLDEIRELTGAGTVSIDSVVSRRYHVGQLLQRRRELEHQRDLIQNQVELCRQALVAADQRVKALEKLQEKQARDFEELQEKKAGLAREEHWLAVHGT